MHFLLEKDDLNQEHPVNRTSKLKGKIIKTWIEACGLKHGRQQTN
jgi:hypothetical protein